MELTSNGIGGCQLPHRCAVAYSFDVERGILGCLVGTLPVLASDDVSGVPIWPVLISLAEALLMFAGGCFRTAECAREIACGAERSRSRVEAPGKPRRDLLQQPAIAVGVAE
jgi:hypothetical protein